MKHTLEDCIKDLASIESERSKNRLTRKLAKERMDTLYCPIMKIGEKYIFHNHIHKREYYKLEKYLKELDSKYHYLGYKVRVIKSRIKSAQLAAEQQTEGENKGN